MDGGGGGSDVGVGSGGGGGHSGFGVHSQATKARQTLRTDEDDVNECVWFGRGQNIYEYLYKMTRCRIR